MECTFRSLVCKYLTKLFVYVDDVLITTGDDLAQRRQITDEVFDLLTTESYFLCPTKCSFKERRVEYLGVIIDGNKLYPNPKKTSPLKDWPRTLSSIREVQSFW